MLVENISLTPVGTRQVQLSWTSESETTRSWIFINGRFSVGPFLGDTQNRTVVLTIPTETTFLVEIHDFEDDTVPYPIEQEPLVRPTLTFNEVTDAVAYRIYHKLFDTDEPEVLLAEIPARIGPMEVLSPMKLEGKNGHWHSFRVEAVDKYYHESANENIPYFTIDFPPVPQLTVSRDITSGLLTFRII